MILVGTTVIPNPHIVTDEEKIARDALFVMECNARRMKQMIELGYYCKEYSEAKWQEFKQILPLLQANKK